MGGGEEKIGIGGGVFLLKLACFGAFFFDFCSYFAHIGFVFFFVFLVECCCKFLSYRVLQLYHFAENWVRLA